MLGYMVAGIEEIMGLHGHGFWSVSSLSQPVHDVKTTFYGRCYDVKTLKQWRSNVVLTSCAG